MTGNFMKKTAITLSLSVVMCMMSLTAYAKFNIFGQNTGGGQMTVGEVKNDVYENEYCGYSVGLPKGFKYLDAKGVAEIDGSSEEFIKDKDAVLKSIDKGNTVIVAYAEDSGGYNNVNIGLAKYGTSLGISEKELYDETISDIKAEFEEMGFTITDIDVVKATIAGEEHYIIDTKAKLSGYNMYQKQAMLMGEDYAMCVTATSFDDDITDDMLAKIEKIK
ncbi:hypothetical protein [Oribacterium sp. WCC10]|uniref:hypothetical protein n=1 Tax=Oribacterium sp. WCC10 TaxID=1855343 RepID=UPI0008E7DB3F|nr:hypothetical protein [Oribacterium sp. WCC10]SFG49033.1 hypothetical protein SAMN05216356_11090 [Oribacterium sp. WCC10]